VAVEGRAGRRRGGQRVGLLWCPSPAGTGLSRSGAVVVGGGAGLGEHGLMGTAEVTALLLGVSCPIRGCCSSPHRRASLAAA